MKYNDPKTIQQLLDSGEDSEAILLVKKNKNLPHTLHRLISIKRKLAKLNEIKAPYGPQEHE